MCRRSLSQRLEIAAAYEADVSRSLIDEIKSKVNGNVKSVYIGLLMSVPEFYSRQLRKMKNDGAIENIAIAILSFDLSEAFDDSGADDTVLVEIMCTMSNSEIRKICATYQQLFGKRLEQAIRENKSGDFKKLLKILSAAGRDESTIIDIAAAKDDAEKLKKNFENFSLDEKELIEIFSTNSFLHIKLVSDEFKKLTGNTLEKTIKKNTSDRLKKALLAIVRTSISPPQFFARRINKAINNFILDNRSLGRMIIMRSEIDLMDVKEEFNRIFRKSLMSCLKGDISGSYKEALLTLMGEK